MDYKKYKEDVSDDIRSCLEEMGCQPILFIGSGFTKRYAGGLSWEELLKYLAEQCPEINRKFAYYKQKYPDLVDIGTVFAEKYNNWAWAMERNFFLQNYMRMGTLQRYILSIQSLNFLKN